MPVDVGGIGRCIGIFVVREKLDFGCWYIFILLQTRFNSKKCDHSRIRYWWANIWILLNEHLVASLKTISCGYLQFLALCQPLTVGVWWFSSVALCLGSSSEVWTLYKSCRIMNNVLGTTYYHPVLYLKKLVRSRSFQPFFITLRELKERGFCKITGRKNEGRCLIKPSLFIISCKLKNLLNFIHMHKSLNNAIINSVTCDVHNSEVYFLRHVDNL